jgi:hypothetical protein
LVSELIGLRRLVATVTAATALVIATDARAEGDVEPSYGRIEGDVTVVVGAGASIASGGPRAAAELRARYLETAGLFATYEDGALVGSSVDPRRVLAFGLELRPLFLYRWLKGHETRRARWDLLLDSLGLELGMTWAGGPPETPPEASMARPGGAPGNGFGSHPGIDAGLGLELPLFSEATGLWLALHGGLRWSDDALASGPVHPDDREAYLALTLAWHQVVSTHLVDFGDEAPR